MTEDLNELDQDTGEGKDPNDDGGDFCEQMEKPDEQGLPEGGIVGSHNDEEHQNQPDEKPDGRPKRGEKAER